MLLIILCSLSLFDSFLLNCELFLSFDMILEFEFFFSSYLEAKRLPIKKLKKLVSLQLEISTLGALFGTNRVSLRSYYFGLREIEMAELN